MADLQAIAGDIVALSEGDILEVNPECTATFDERRVAWIALLSALEPSYIGVIARLAARFGFMPSATKQGGLKIKWC